MNLFYRTINSKFNSSLRWNSSLFKIGCRFQTRLWVLIFVHFFFASVQACQKQIFNFSFFRIIICLKCFDSLIFFLFLIVLFFQNQYAQITRCIVCTEESEYLLHNMLFWSSVFQKQILDVFFYLVVSWVNTQIIDFLLSLW